MRASRKGLIAIAVTAAAMFIPPQSFAARKDAEVRAEMLDALSTCIGRAVHKS